MPWKDKAKEAAYKKAYYEKRKDIWSYEARKGSAKKWREKNIDKIRAIGKERYWDNKPDELRKAKAWREKNSEYVKSKDHKNTELLTDRYMRKHLLKLGYTRQHIRKHPELIETHRIIIKTKRLCKTLEN